MNLANLPASLEKAIERTEKAVIKKLKERIEELEKQLEIKEAEIVKLSELLENAPRLYDSEFLEKEKRKHVTKYGY